MTTTTKTTTKPATKSATQKATTKPVNKPVVKSTAHGLTIAMIAGLDAFRARFLGRAIEYHNGAGRIKRTGDAFALTPDGVKFFSGRPDVAHARECMAKGGKSEKGIAYIKAPSGFPSPYVYPFGGAQEEGRKDSKAAFGALMLIVSGK